MRGQGQNWRRDAGGGGLHHRVNTPLCVVLNLEELTGMATKLYVGNLSPNTTENQILELFKQSGNVTSCQLIMDKVTNKSKGFAFVEMGSEAEAAKALSDRSGKELDGRALKVNEAKPREERSMKS
jgi:RNA recognition motif-containing protein